ncbi:hypothetical protein CEXT_176131 [Caerostris extrusa]|uniref:Ribosomal protein S10 n=1 Tax=Caerostris extrusa TaxID=172846 RepID=A0AAV4P025_CAEEX|nr:hypothetical protein CEXT_176131 [Caerostris extrusa]
MHSRGPFVQIHLQLSLLLKGEANLIYKQVKNNISETCDNPLKPQRDFNNELTSHRRVTIPPLSDDGERGPFVQIHLQLSLLLKEEANLIYKQVKNNISEICDNLLKPQRDFNNEPPSRRRVTMPLLSDAGERDPFVQIHLESCLLLKGEANLIYKEVKNNISETCDNPLKPQIDFNKEKVADE